MFVRTYSVSKDFSFEAAHLLRADDDVCKKCSDSIHGHSYKVKVTVFGRLNKNDMVVDFNRLSNIVHDLIDKWDHSLILPNGDVYLYRYTKGVDCGLLNSNKTHLWSDNPTAEVMAFKIAHHVIAYISLSLSCDMVTVTVNETEKCSATCTLQKKTTKKQKKG